MRKFNNKLKGKKTMNKKIKTEAVDHLFQAILTLKDVEECYKFFEEGKWRYNKTRK